MVKKCLVRGTCTICHVSRLLCNSICVYCSDRLVKITNSTDDPSDKAITDALKLRDPRLRRQKLANYLKEHEPQYLKIKQLLDTSTAEVKEVRRNLIRRDD